MGSERGRPGGGRGGEDDSFGTGKVQRVRGEPARDEAKGCEGVRSVNERREMEGAEERGVIQVLYICESNRERTSRSLTVTNGRLNKRGNGREEEEREESGGRERAEGQKAEQGWGGED